MRRGKDGACFSWQVSWCAAAGTRVAAIPGMIPPVRTRLLNDGECNVWRACICASAPSLRAGFVEMTHRFDPAGDAQRMRLPRCRSAHVMQNRTRNAAIVA